MRSTCMIQSSTPQRVLFIGRIWDSFKLCFVQDSTSRILRSTTDLEPTDDEMDMDNNPQTNLSELRERHQWGMYLGAEQCRGFLGAEITNLNALTSLRTRDEDIDLEHKYALGKISLY